MRISLVLVGLGLIAAPFAFAGLGSKNDGERLKELLGGREPRNVQVFAEMKPAESASLIARAGIPSDVMAELRRYAIPAPKELGIYKAALLDAKWSGGDVRIGAMYSPEDFVHRVMAFDAYGKPVVALDPFLAQFFGAYAMIMVGEASNAPIGDAIALRDSILLAADAPAKKDEHARWTLLRHRLLMWKCEALATRFEAAREAGEPLEPLLRELRGQLDELEQFASHLKTVLQPKEVGQYRTFLDEFRAGIDEATAELEKDPARGATVAKAKVKRGCTECHSWDGNAARKPFESIVREAREERGIKNGVFVVDMDVRTRGLSTDDAQAIASAVKAALLAAKEAK